MRKVDKVSNKLNTNKLVNFVKILKSIYYLINYNEYMIKASLKSLNKL